MTKALQSSVSTILDAFDLDPAHPEACLREAQAWRDNPGLDDPGLRDLRSLPFVTIDNQDSRDLDQALFISTGERGTGFRLYYALADAAWYVRPGSALFDEALRRGVTYYLPGVSVPMLPRSLSEDLVSLNPDVDRRALVFDIRLDPQGVVEQTEVYRGLIHSQAKLSYPGVQEMLDRETSASLSRANYRASLSMLRDLGRKRIKLARQRNVIAYNRQEAQVIASGNPEHFEIRVRARNDVERYNEQISLLCNIEGAKLLEKYARLTPELQSVFRVHAPPLDQRLNDLRKHIGQIVDAHELPSLWRWTGQAELADYLEGLPRQPATRRIRQAIERQIMLTNNASEFSSQPGPHHALGVDAYARFSAPMREIVGIYTHKELLEGLGLEKPLARSQDLELQQRVITVSNFCKQQQKRLDKECQLLVIDRFLHADLNLPLAQRPTRRGTLAGMDARKIYVAVDGFALDLKVYKEDLESQCACEYHMHGARAYPAQAEAPVYRTGDEVELRTFDWDETRRRFVLTISHA